MENTWHVFLTCPKSIQVWKEALFQILHSFDCTARAKFGTIMWSIWKDRNSLLWENKSTQPHQMVNLVVQFISDWRKAKELSSYSHLHHQIFHMDQNLTSWGICVWDHQGDFVLAQTGCSSPCVAVLVMVSMAYIFG